MSNQNLTRRTAVELAFGGVDITASIRPYLKSITYTDNEADETDDLQIQLHDRESIWTEQWLAAVIDSAGASGLSISAAIVRRNWHGDGKDIALLCGDFELDSVAVSGPPSVIVIKATSLPFSAAVMLEGWGAFDGKYIVTQAVHKVEVLATPHR